MHHSWEISRYRLAGADRDAGVLITSGGAPWGFFQWGGPTRYHLEDFREALDSLSTSAAALQSLRSSV